jgi:hypothetical protein
MTIGPARQNLDLIEAEARQAAEEVLQGTGVDWEFVVRSGDPGPCADGHGRRPVGRGRRGGRPAA